MRYLLLALFLLIFFLAPALADDGGNHGGEGVSKNYRLLSDTLACPLPKALNLSRDGDLDSRVRLALSSRLVQPPAEEAEELDRIERISIFIGLRCLLD